MNGEIIFAWAMLALFVGLVFGVGGIIVSEIRRYQEKKRRRRK